MAFGMNYDTAAGDIVPVLKFDARAGRFFRVDRADGQNNPVDITQGFKAVMDFENVEVGYIHFPAGAAPEFRMVPIGSAMPENPGGKFRQGVRLMLKLSGNCGGDVREIATTAKAVLSAFDACHTEYMAGLPANPGKLPVVSLKTTVPVVTQGRDDKGNPVKTTNYSPVFEITGWVNRPDDLVFVPKGGGAPAQQAAQQQAAQAPAATPPSTGSTAVSAPAAADDDDFG